MDDFDEAIVFHAAFECLNDGASILDAADAVRRPHDGGMDSQQVLRVRRAFPGADNWRVRQGRVEAVQMPVEAAALARAHDDSTVIGGRLVTAVADDGRPITLAQLEEVWRFLVALLVPARGVS